MPLDELLKLYSQNGPVKNNSSQEEEEEDNEEDVKYFCSKRSRVLSLPRLIFFLVGECIRSRSR